MKQKTICFVAGKSGGHIIPCLTLAQQEKGKDNNARVIFFSTSTPLDSSILANKSYIDRHIVLPITAACHTKIMEKIKTSAQLTRSFFAALRQLYAYKRTSLSIRVVSTGGFIAIPVCFAAKLLRIPVELYELNVIPGKATKFLAPFANRVHICFKKTADLLPNNACELTPYPVRFMPAEKTMNHAEACMQLNLDPALKTLLIIGGSQGSVGINQIIKTAIDAHSAFAQTIQIIHQTGSVDHTNWRAFYADNNISAIVFDYCDNIAPYYTAADLVISRAGAGTLFELLFLNKQTIIIPLETKTNTHQLNNAQEMVIQNQRLFTMLRQDSAEKNSHELAHLITTRLKTPRKTL